MKNHRLISVILSAVASVAAASAAAHAGISAQVVNSHTGEPVEFACISNASHTIGFMADALGRFTLTAEEMPADSLIISRVGYRRASFLPSAIPSLIRLEPDPVTLQTVTVTPKRKKTLGSMFIPNELQKAAFDIVTKIDITHSHLHRYVSELGRHFKFKHDSRINRIRVCLNKNDSITLLFNLYRRADDQWVPVNSRPIVVDVPVSDDWRNIVEINVADIIDPLPKGEYLVGIAKHGDGQFGLWSRQPLFEDGRQRIIGTDKWKNIDDVPGIEIEIEY